jgi:hypothetical protein
MIYTVIASNEEESRFFALAAGNEEDAKQCVRGSIGDRYVIEVTHLSEILHCQFQGISELTPAY